MGLLLLEPADPFPSTVLTVTTSPGVSIPAARSCRPECGNRLRDPHLISASAGAALGSPAIIRWRPDAATAGVLRAEGDGRDRGITACAGLSGQLGSVSTASPGHLRVCGGT